MFVWPVTKAPFWGRCTRLPEYRPKVAESNSSRIHRCETRPPSQANPYLLSSPTPPGPPPPPSCWFVAPVRVSVCLCLCATTFSKDRKPPDILSIQPTKHCVQIIRRLLSNGNISTTFQASPISEPQIEGTVLSLSPSVGAFDFNAPITVLTSNFPASRAAFCSFSGLAANVTATVRSDGNAVFCVPPPSPASVSVTVEISFNGVDFSVSNPPAAFVYCSLGSYVNGSQWSVSPGVFSIQTFVSSLPCSKGSYNPNAVASSSCALTPLSWPAFSDEVESTGVLCGEGTSLGTVAASLSSLW